MMADTHESQRADELAAKLVGLRPGKILTITCEEDPATLARQACDRADGTYDHQTIHLPRKKGDLWLLHLRRLDSCLARI